MIKTSINKRKRICILLDKIQKEKEFSKKIGIKDTTVFKNNIRRNRHETRV